MGERGQEPTELDTRASHPGLASERAESCAASGKLAFLICVSGIMKVQASERVMRFMETGVEASSDGPEQVQGLDTTY